MRRASRFCRSSSRSSGRDWRTNLLADFLDECLRAAAVTSLVLDDFADQLGLCLGRTGPTVAHLGGELPSLERRGPLLLLGNRGPVRLTVMRRLGLRHVMECGRFGGPASSAVTPGTGGGEAKRVPDATISAADTAGFTRHNRERR